MEYQNIKNFKGYTPNQPSKFRIKNWIKINDEARGTHNTNSKIEFNFVVKIEF